ncbi:MAG: HlyC/CorC family transporter [Myxococcales bacterium]|nr:HlyC/CorC family transporter [Myxococcales bacterium]
MFAAAEAAMSSLTEPRLQTLASEKPNVFGRYGRDRVRVLSRWLVARILAISLASVLVRDVAETFVGARPAPLVAVVGALLTYGTFAEVLATLARRRPEEVGAAALRFLWPLEWLVVPLAAPLALLGRWVGRRFEPVSTITESEVEWALSQGQRQGAIEEEPAEMIRNVLDLKDVTAREVMVPRRRIVGVDLAMSLDDVLALVASEGHSRYPVYRDTVDHVVGLLYAKDLFDVVAKGKTAGKRAEDLARKAVLFVTETQLAASVLHEMRARRQHMAVVTDEFGGTSGVVTLEDILEEIVGDIHDEHDTDADSQILKIAEGRYVADAAVPLSDLEPYIGMVLPAEGEFESLGGLIVERSGRVPEVGTEVKIDGYTLIVREADETRVVRVEIVKKAPDLEPPTEARA